MHQRGQSTLEYLALLALLCVVLGAVALTARLRHIGPDVIGALRTAVVGDRGAVAARADALRIAGSTLSGDARSTAATTNDAEMLLTEALGARGASSELAALAESVVRARRPDLFAPRSYVLVPTLADDDLRDERRALLLKRAKPEGDVRSVETTAGDRPAQARLLTQADEARGLLVAAGEKESAARHKAWLTSLAPLAIVGVAALTPESIAGVAAVGPGAVAGAGRAALEGSAVADLVAKVRSGQRAVYPAAARRGDVIVCLPVNRTNRSGDPVPVPGVSYTNRQNSSNPIAMTFALWHSVALRAGVVIDEEVTRDSPCASWHTW